MVFLILQCLLSEGQLIRGRKRKKQKYKVVTPAPVCIERQESVFSVTGNKDCLPSYDIIDLILGFLTFSVVAATAVSNVISNIDNNNNNVMKQCNKYENTLSLAINY